MSVDDVCRKLRNNILQEQDKAVTSLPGFDEGADAEDVGSFSERSLTEAIQLIEQLGGPPKIRARPEAIARLEAELAPRRIVFEGDELDWHALTFSGIQIEAVDDLPCLWELRTKNEVSICIELGKVVTLPMPDPEEWARETLEKIREELLAVPFKGVPDDLRWPLYSRLPDLKLGMTMTPMGYIPTHMIQERREAPRRKRSSKSWRKHVRREKARKRREALLG